ncbi:hypothetical protein DB313_05180 (plasmid) [Borrelia turcica IST7]|uniref:Lipoprotein n=1 Tax=Borrelia turcica IST7 TaxID=1104446 RepID=A0A386PNP1_9SPIR|nr:hypothetical protein [Borrelia turcica]AYE36892.1 hypothetical protein DB313_05180 [Borrelia turcica IST7]
MNKINICILPLLYFSILACQNSITDSDSEENDTGEVAMSTSDFQSDDGQTETITKLTITKLSKEDVTKLKDFVEKTKEYGSTLISIYNNNIGTFNNINSYSVVECDDYTEGNKSKSWCKNWNKKRKEYLEKLKKDNKLTDEFKKLVAMIKTDISAYIPQALTDAIAKLEEALKKGTTEPVKAVDAQSTIDTFYETIDTAITSYADAFVHLASTLSSKKFADATKSFADATKVFVDNKHDAAISGVVLGIRAVVSQEGIDKAKQAAKIFGPEGEKFAPAIDTLDAAYKTVKP